MKYLILLFCILNSYYQVQSQKNQIFSVYFEVNSFKLSTIEAQNLNQFIKKSIANKISIVQLQAYTDSTGSMKLNQKLSDNRLKTIQLELQNAGLNQNFNNQSNAENYSNSMVKFDQSDLKNWRRVDIVYSDSKKEFDKPEMVKKDTINKFVNTAKFRENALSESGIVLDVQFYGGTADMFPNAMQDIVALAEFLKANKNLKTLVRGHVCCMDDYPLSMKRAEAVYNTLIQLGIETNRLDYKGFSNYMRVADPEVTEADKQRNRRVDVVFTKIN